MFNSVKPTRLAVAQKVCRYLPPIISQRVGCWLYSPDSAKEDDFKFIAKAHTGSRLEGTTKDLHFRSFSVSGYCVWRNVAVALSLASKGGTIIEIGANVGTETVSFADVVGASGVVHAFEPLPSNAEMLRRAAELSPHRNIVVHECALSNESGIMEFVVPPEYASGIGHLVQSGERGAEMLRVKCMTLDSLAEQVGSASLIFMDTEGEEVNILQGAIRYIETHKPHLVLEASPELLHRAGYSLKDLYQILRDFDYCIYKITRLGLRDVQAEQEYKSTNWLCLSRDQQELVNVVRKCILHCAFLPCVPGLNPLSQLHAV